MEKLITKTSKIFWNAARSGINTKDKKAMYDYCKTLKNPKVASDLVFKASWFKDAKKCYKPLRLAVHSTIEYAKFQIKSGRVNTNYMKVLVIWNSNIYWASPIFKHGDYNKSIALENNETNRRIAFLVNKVILKTN